MKYLGIVMLMFVLFACGGPKLLVNFKEQAKNAEVEKDYVTAVENWKQYFDQKGNESITGQEFAQAAVNAFNVNNHDLALLWFDQARYKNYSDARMYASLAEIYRSKKNISKELSALEFYTTNFSDTMSIINNRLFDIYAEINLLEQALASWEKLNEQSKSQAGRLLSYFNINKKLEKNSVCDSVSLVLLELQPENIEALEWNGKKYYWTGQNRYNSEMEKYNKKKNSKTYKVLLKQLDLVTADFKKALPHLTKLWKIEPGKEYAGYLANIYARFGDEKTAEFYKKYLK